MISPVRSARLDQKLTIEQLAAKANVHPKTIRRVEARQHVREATLQSLAKALDINPSDIASDLAGMERAA